MITSRTSLRRLLAAALTIASIGLATGELGSDRIVRAAAPADDDWIGIVNAYRSQSGLAPVTEEPSWSEGGRNHSCWMLLNGIAHDEPAGTPGYTASGDEAGNRGNVAVSSSASATARRHIDLWMTGPFHAIGILRPTLTRSGFGMCASPPNPSATSWKSAATLDVVRGIDSAAAVPSTPVVFPGDGATTSLTRFIAETPDPRSFCGWSTRSVGLPLIAMFPSDVSSASASLSGPAGPIEACVLHAGNTSGVAQGILRSDNAVVVVPAEPLATGNHRVSVRSSGGDADWSFDVDPNAVLGAATVPPPPLDATTMLDAGTPFELVTPFRLADSRGGLGLGRLAPEQQVRVRIAGVGAVPSDATAVSANFTIDRSSDGGYLTASNCAETNPSVSTLNFVAGDAVSNQAIIPLDRGDICLFANVATDVIIDVNGFAAPDATRVFSPVTPKRLFDTRGASPLVPGTVLRVDVEGGASPAPDDAVAVAINLTGTGGSEDGWVRAFPCGVTEPESSALNPRAGHDRANSAIVPTGSDGSICFTSSITTHLIVDITGWFGDRAGHRFAPLRPIRLADTRSAHPDLNGDSGIRMLAPDRELRVQVAGARGVPVGARAATLNIVATDGPSGGWLRVVPCGGSSDVSNLNYTAGSPVANGANVMLDASGAVCVTSSSPTHVIVDLTGVWT